MLCFSDKTSMEGLHFIKIQISGNEMKPKGIRGINNIIFVWVWRYAVDIVIEDFTLSFSARKNQKVDWSLRWILTACLVFTDDLFEISDFFFSCHIYFDILIHTFIASYSKNIFVYI